MATPVRHIRVPDVVWDLAKERAAREGTTISAVVNDCLTMFIENPEDPE